MALFTVWTSLISALCGLSVQSSANRKYFDDDSGELELPSFIFSCILILSISTAVVFCVVYLFQSSISEFLNFSTQWIVLGIPFAYCSFLIQLRLGQWLVRDLAGTFATFNITKALINAVLSIILVVFLALGVSGRIGAMLIANIFFAGLAFYLLNKDKLIKVSWRPDLISEALRFGVPLIPHMLGAFLLLTVDRAVISSVLGVDKAGIYMVAVQVASVVALGLDAINKAFMPWLFNKLKTGSVASEYEVVRITYKYYLILTFGVIVSFVIAGDVLLLLVSEDYNSAAKIVSWIILAQAFRGGYLMVTNYIFYEKRTELIAGITIGTGMVNVMLLYAFTESYGLIGAAWAFCISMTIQWILTWYLANKIHPMPWFSAFRSNK